MVDWAMLARTSDRKPRQLAAKRGTAMTNSRDGQLQAWLHPEALPLAASTALASFFRSMLYTPPGERRGGRQLWDSTAPAPRQQNAASLSQLV